MAGTDRLFKVVDLTDGERLLINRNRKGLTQAQFAELVNMSTVVYGQCERDVQRWAMEPAALGQLKPHEQCLIARRRAGLTQAEVAKDMKCSRYWVNLMEAGKTNPDDLVRYWSAA